MAEKNGLVKKLTIAITVPLFLAFAGHYVFLTKSVWSNNDFRDKGDRFTKENGLQLELRLIERIDKMEERFDLKLEKLSDKITGS